MAGLHCDWYNPFLAYLAFHREKKEEEEKEKQEHKLQAKKR